MPETQTKTGLSQKYPHIPTQHLQDLLELEADEEQLTKTNKDWKVKTHKRLKDYTLTDIPENINSPEEGRRLTVAVIGASGSGKRATGNTLLQDLRFVTSASATAQTTSFHTEQVGRQDVLVHTAIDTPGSWSIPKEKKVDLYILVINLTSPRFEKRHLEMLHKLKDYNNILSNKRCILLLTHAADALGDKPLTSYLEEIQGDPLHDLIIRDMEGWRVMAINNSCDTRYEENSQWKMIMSIMKSADMEANYDRASSLLMHSLHCCVPIIKEYYPVIIGVGAFLLFVFIVGITLFAVEQWP